MTIPNLKRVKVSSVQELRNWLARHPDHDDSVMLVTHDKTARQKHVSRDQLHDVLAAHGWTGGRRYTLNGTLIGEVISRHCNDRRSVPAQGKTTP